MFSRTGADAFRPGLGNIQKLCSELGDPQQRIRTIHIAGTNGKGSTSHMLAAILQEAGYKTGLYTSPHLKDFRERIKIDGEMISREFVVNFTREIEPLIAELEPSFFEITVAMAFSFFARKNVDVAVIETGLGGRLDSTNIIIPEVSVITNIGYDHMNLLGDTLEMIAGEKAGIIKKQVPVVIGETLPETLPVFQHKAAEMEAPLSIASETREAINKYWVQDMLVVETLHHLTNKKQHYRLDLPGIYQAKNLLTVLETCSCLQQKGWSITEEHIAKGLANTRRLTGLHGRWEIVHHSPLVVLDVAHNTDGITQLMQQISLTPHEQLHLVIGMVKDKDVAAVLRLLPPAAKYYFTRAQIPRALPEDELQHMAAAIGLQGNHFSTVDFALISAAQQARKKDMVVVCGSVFLVGEVSKAAIREIWGKKMPSDLDYLESAGGLELLD